MSGEEQREPEAAALPLVLDVLAGMYLEPPTRDAVHSWRAALAGRRTTLGAPLLAELDAAAAGSDAQFDALQTEFTRLFVGPAATPCPPWESLYSASRKQMLQEAHDAVAALYRAAGLAVNMRGVLPDHIGAELHFLSRLIVRLDGCAADEREAVLRLADSLLDDHLNQWIGPFTRDVEGSARHPLYTALAQTTRRVVAALQDG
jgi:TorA maturation chaperone TorD